MATNPSKAPASEAADQAEPVEYVIAVGGKTLIHTDDEFVAEAGWARLTRDSTVHQQNWAVTLHVNGKLIANVKALVPHGKPWPRRKSTVNHVVLAVVRQALRFDLKLPDLAAEMTDLGLPTTRTQIDVAAIKQSDTKGARKPRQVSYAELVVMVRALGNALDRTLEPVDGQTTG